MENEIFIENYKRIKNSFVSNEPIIIIIGKPIE